MTTLSLNQRKQNNFQNIFFFIEAGFYFFQGIYISGLNVFTSFYLANVFGLSMVEIASIMAVSGIPMYLKMFTGLLSDKVPVGKFGRRKPYLFLGAVFFIIAFAFLVSLKDYSPLWMIALLLCNFSFVLVDGTADALTVDITPDQHATKMQGYANGGRYAGMAIGVLIASFLPQQIGWTPVIIILGAAAILQAVTAMLFLEIKEQNEDDKPKFFQSFKLGFGNKGAILGLVFAFLFMGSFGVTYVMNPVIISNVSTELFGTANLLGYAAVALTAWLGGTLLNKTGGVTNKAIFILFILIWLLMTPWLLVMGNWDKPALVITAVVTMGIARGIVTLTTYSVLMRLCSETLEGFMFAIFTSLMNFGLGALTPKIVAYFGETLGWGMIPALFVMIPVMFIGVLTVPGINQSLVHRNLISTANNGSDH